jgi:hypothetical protein
VCICFNFVFSSKILRGIGQLDVRYYTYETWYIRE